ncbi:TPA: hypothetical protein CPT91_05025 [Candidatus Gastranaerophilales bacterium HUM_16]|nr:MAG TPA: hypothetical protein CPT91_05025 [Candidatus Gastranaerophilales bacterium HUM_16]
MLTYQDAQEIYYRNHGTTQYFKRVYCNNLFYTDGVMDFQRSLETYWIVDNVISYMPKILERFRKYESTYYTVDIVLNKEYSGFMEVYAEDYNDNGDFDEHITIIKQDIPFIDLPYNEDEELTSYKMYLRILSYEKEQFVLLLPTED